jgi:hypothetical protein
LEEESGVKDVVLGIAIHVLNHHKLEVILSKVDCVIEAD